MGEWGFLPFSMLVVKSIGQVLEGRWAARVAWFLGAGYLLRGRVSQVEGVGLWGSEETVVCRMGEALEGQVFGVVLVVCPMSTVGVEVAHPLWVLEVLMEGASQVLVAIHCVGQVEMPCLAQVVEGVVPSPLLVRKQLAEAVPAW